jgi:O-acetyl-ADP-ribose deacetylase (regulator of RNase III)
MIEIVTGDVLNSGESIVVHGCNCKHAMGAGIARQIREECPAAYKADRETLWGDRDKLGTYTYGVEDREHGKMTVVNAYIQYDYGHERRHLSYDALITVLERICQDFDEPVIAMPKIGCGLAGGDWIIVRVILEAISAKYGKLFRVYKLEKR